MHRSTRIATFALAALIVVPALATATMSQRAKPAVDGKTTAEIMKLAKRSRGMSAANKSAFASTAFSTSSALQTGNASSIFTNAATDKAAIIGYFAASKLSTVKIGLPLLDNGALGKQLRIVGGFYPDTKIQEVTTDLATKIESGKFDENEVTKSLDVLITALGTAYAKRGEEANFNFNAGTQVGYAVVLGILYKSQPMSAQSQIQKIMTKVQDNAKALLKEPMGDLPEGPKAAFTEFSTARMIDSDSTFEAVGKVDDAYIAALD